MSDNLEAAEMVRNKPVLFIQGSNDKLIRPAGTWKLFQNLSTANRQLVMSKSSEHLIFEEGQFKPEDLSFVLAWIGRNIAALDLTDGKGEGRLPVVAAKTKTNVEEVDSTPETKPDTSTTIDTTGDTIIASSSPRTLPPPNSETSIKNAPKINFWIELSRSGKRYRCNNKTAFKSGDSIRFHLIPESDGYAYLVMRKGTTGKSQVLFPNEAYGVDNHLLKGKDYPIPSSGWMQFDENPGTEQLGLLYAHEKVDMAHETFENALTCYVLPSDSGAKDLSAAGMNLKCDDSKLVPIPDDFSAINQLTDPTESSLVRLTPSTTTEMIAAQIDLLHKE